MFYLNNLERKKSLLTCFKQVETGQLRSEKYVECSKKKNNSVCEPGL